MQDDWSSWLSPAKAATFDSCTQYLETLYHMFSVSLNEALELRRTGKAGQSCQAIFMSPALCSRLARPLEALLRTLAEQAKHFGIVPNTAPLNSANFRSSQQQHSARMNDLLSLVLLTQRSQFLHKIDTLHGMVFTIRSHFHQVASDLACGASLAPSADWRAVDDAHYDLNTCLREAIVVLKSFLVVLPDDQVTSFQDSIKHQLLASYHPEPTRGGCMVQIEGE